MSNHAEIRFPLILPNSGTDGGAGTGGSRPESLAKKFEPSGETIRNWVIQAERDEGVRSDGPSHLEQEELRRLRRENKQLRIEREVLAKLRPGSLARPTRGPARLRVQETAPGRLSGWDDVPRAEGLPSGYYAWLKRPPSLPRA